MRCEQLTTTKNDAIQSQEMLRNEIKSLQQHVHTTLRMDVTGHRGGPGSGSAGTVLLTLLSLFLNIVLLFSFFLSLFYSCQGSI